MGWKAFALFATNQAPGYFGSVPSHDPGLAESMRARLGLSAYESAGLRTFDEAMYPPKGSLFLGAYPEGLAICDLDLPCYFFDEKPRKRISGTKIEFEDFKSKLLGIYPNGQVLAIVLHSVVNLWGYSLYSRGQLVRSVAGASDDGLIVNVGPPLPEEERVLRDCPIDKIDEEGLGEDMVFSHRVFSASVWTSSRKLSWRCRNIKGSRVVQPRSSENSGGVPDPPRSR